MSAAASIEIRYPYPGFRPFEEWESELFFGRDGQTERMLEKLTRQHFLAVVGTSASGKSSLVKAGLLPTIRGGFLPPGGTHWRITRMEPTGEPVGDPFGNLASAGALDNECLRSHSLGLVEAAEKTLEQDQRLLVVVDQFEEIFRYAKEHAEEASLFVTMLIEASRQRRVPVYIVLTMRSEFLGQCSRFHDLPEAINESQYLVPRMTREERREAIVGPAVAMGPHEPTPRLVELLLDKAGDDPEQLPRLQHLLRRIRILAEGEILDIAHYQAAGEWDHALSNHLDRLYEDLQTDRLKAVARKMFQRLGETGPEGAVTRRSVDPEELRGLVELRASAEEIGTVIDAFSREGKTFLRLGKKITVSHESLFRTWEKMNDPNEGWFAEERKGQKIYTSLLESAGKGERSWSGPRFEEALNWWNSEHPTAQWGERYGGRFETADRLIRRSKTRRALRRAGFVAIPAACLGVAALFIVLWVRARNSEKAALAAQAATAEEAKTQIGLAPNFETNG